MWYVSNKKEKKFRFHLSSSLKYLINCSHAAIQRQHANRNRLVESILWKPGNFAAWEAVLERGEGFSIGELTVSEFPQVGTAKSGVGRIL